jgi:hypothetical protein
MQKMPIAEACLLKFPVPGEKKVVVSQRFPLDNMGRLRRASMFPVRDLISHCSTQGLCTMPLIMRLRNKKSPLSRAGVGDLYSEFSY